MRTKRTLKQFPGCWHESQDHDCTISRGHLAAVGVVFGEHLELAEIAAQEQQLRTSIGQATWLAFAIGVAVYYVTSLIPGTSGKSIVVGWLFGVAQGVAIVLLGLTAAALTTFSLSRFLLRDVVESRLAVFQRRLNNALESDGAFYLLTLRMLHVPYTLLNYVCGVCRVSWWTFAWTTAVGLLPGTCVFVFLGANLPTLHELITDGAEQLISPWLWLALLATGLLPWLARSVARAMKQFLKSPAINP